MRGRNGNNIIHRTSIGCLIFVRPVETAAESWCTDGSLISSADQSPSWQWPHVHKLQQEKQLRKVVLGNVSTMYHSTSGPNHTKLTSPVVHMHSKNLLLDQL